MTTHNPQRLAKPLPSIRRTSLVLGLLCLLVAPSFGANVAQWRSDFETLNYSDSTGSTGWNGNWTEWNESDGSGTGDIRLATDTVVNPTVKSLHVMDNNRGIYRFFDVRPFTYDRVTLRVRYRREGLDNSTDEKVFIHIDSSSQTPITLSGPADDSNYAIAEADITNLVDTAGTTYIWLRTPDGGMSGAEGVMFDWIEIVAESFSTFFTVTGRVFEDVNGNGVYDAGTDNPIPNVTVQPGAVTDANGIYTASVPQGNSTITVDIEDPDLTYDVYPDLIEEASQTVNITGNTSGIDFPFKPAFINPDLDGVSCAAEQFGLLIMDASGSISEAQQVVVRDGVQAYLETLVGRNANVAMTEFGLTARTLLDFTLVTNSSLTNQFIPALQNDYHDGTLVGWTNWEAGLKEMNDRIAAAGIFPDYIVFITDGEPNHYIGADGQPKGPFQNTEAFGVLGAHSEATIVKQQGIHFYGFYIGDAGAGDSFQSIRAISSSTTDSIEFEPPTFNINQADWTRSESFADFIEKLIIFGDQVCRGSNSNVITGTVFEDQNADSNRADQLPIPNSVVSLYRDIDGDGIINNFDFFVESTTTSASGGYVFDDLIPGDYVVAVDSKSLNPPAGYNAGFGNSNGWPEQTYGPVDALCDDGTGTEFRRTTRGPCYGGRAAGTSDDFANQVPQHIAHISFAEGDVRTQVDFGFSWNAVTHTAAGDTRDDSTGDARTVQGSLRQFIDNANAYNGDNHMRFVPTVPATDSSGNGSWWHIDISNVLPTMSDTQTTIDGRAWEHTDGTLRRDALTGSIGSSTVVGTGADGREATGDETALTQVPRAELEVRDGAAIGTGLNLSGTQHTIRDISIHGFGNGVNSNGDASIMLEATANDATIQDALIGFGPDAVAAPASPSGGDGIRSNGADSGTVTNSIVAFNTGNGIALAASSAGWDIQNNEVTANNLGSSSGSIGGIRIGGNGADNNLVQGNLITANGASGVYQGTGGDDNSILNNTINGNGIGSSGVNAGSTPGIRAAGDRHIIGNNVIASNYGAGILAHNAANDLTFTKNAIYDNGEISDADGGAATNQIGIDLTISGESTSKGTAGYVTLNDIGDADVGANDILNYPIIETAVVRGDGNVEITGFARPGSIIEFFVADEDSSGFGEGRTYFVTVPEGGTEDLDNGTGSYGPGNVNGRPQGQDSTNRFEFKLPVDGLVNAGDLLTATATDGNGATSEFSGLVEVIELIPQPGISGTVFEDINYGGGDGRNLGDASGEPVVGVVVELYNSLGSRIGNTTTDANGFYRFDGILPGNYNVRVVNETVESTRSASGIGAVTDALPVQTFRTDASSGTPVDVLNKVGGEEPAAFDAPANNGLQSLNQLQSGAQAVQSLTPVQMGTEEIESVNFGFNFDTIVNSNDSGQGSLNQFIVNSNVLANDGLAQVGLDAGHEHSIFMLPSNNDPQGRPADSSDQADGIFVLPLTQPLPTIEDNKTTITGLTQTAYTGDDLAAVTCEQTGPEILLDFAGMSGGGQAIRTTGDELIVDSIGITNVLGTGSTTGTAIRIEGANAIVRNSTLGNNATYGISVRGEGAGVLIEDNVISGSASRPNADGMELDTVVGATVRNNCVINNAGYGIDVNSGARDITIQDNIVQGNGAHHPDHNAGIILRVTDSDGSQFPVPDNQQNAVLTGNTVFENTGAGIVTDSLYYGATISQNSFRDNGGVAIDLNPSVNGKGDSVTQNDIDDSDANNGNHGLNFPVFDRAVIDGGTIRIDGIVAPGLQMEFYIADPDPTRFGEGLTYIGTFTEGAGNDLASGTGSYNDPVVGEDRDQARFTFDVALPAGLNAGDRITAIAIDADGNTSEFNYSIPVTPTLPPPAPSESFCYLVADNGPSVNGGNDHLTRVEKVGGANAETYVGATGVSNIEAMTNQPGTQDIFVTNAGELGNLARTTGVYTPIGNVGAGNGSAGLVGFNDVDGLAFDPRDLTGQTLFGIQRRGSSSDALLRINPNTGAFVPGEFAGADYVLLQIVTSTGVRLNTFDDLSFDPIQGVIYAVANDDGANNHLVRINPETGGVSEVGKMNGANDVEGFTIDYDGSLFASSGNTDVFYGVNKDSAAVNNLATLGSPVGAPSGTYTDYEAISCLIAVSDEIDIEVSKTVDNATPNEGDLIQYTITVVNKGPDAATTVAVDEIMPDGLFVLSTVVSDGSYNETQERWILPTLAVDDPQTLTLNVVVQSGTGGQVIPNTAQAVAHAQLDSDSTPNNDVEAEDDQETIQITVQTPTPPVTVEDPARCFLLAGDSADSQFAQDHITRIDLGGTSGSEIYVGKPGARRWEALSFQPATGDLWAAGANRISVLSPGTAVTPFANDVLTATQNYNGSAGPILFDDVIAFSFDPADATGNTMYAVHRRTNTLTDLLFKVDMATKTVVAGAFYGQDYVEIQNQVTDTVELGNAASIAFDPTDRVLYAVLQNNAGNDRLVTIDIFTGQTTIVGPMTESLVQGIGFDNGGNMYAVAGLNPSFFYSVDTASGAMAQVSQLGSGVQDIPPANDPLFEYEAVACNAPPTDVSVAKVVNPTTVNENDVATWTITVTNDGASQASGLIIEDRIDAGVGITNPTPSLGSYDAVNNRWIIPSIAGGESATLTFTSQPSTGSGGNSFDNIAELIDLDQFDSDSTTNNNQPAEDDQDNATLTVNTRPGPNLPDANVCWLVASDSAANDGSDHITRLNNDGSGEQYIGASNTTTVGALENQPGSGTFILVDGDTIYSVNPATGATTAIGTPGSGNGPDGSVALDNMSGAAFDPFDQTGQFLGVLHDRAGDNDLIFAVDANTGAMLTGVFSGNDYIEIQPQGGANNAVAVATHPVTRVNYMVLNNAMMGDVLVTFNVLDGSTTLIGSLGVTNVTGLSFTNQGTLHGVTGGGSSTHFTVNLNTGAAENVTSIGSPSDLPGGLDPLREYEGIACSLPPADVTIEKTVSPTTVAENGTVTWTITATNESGLPATGINISDRLAAGLTFASATPSAGIYDSNSNIWMLPHLAASGSETLTLTSVAPAGSNNLTFDNIAEVTAMDQADTDSTPNNDELTEDDQDNAEFTVNPATPPNVPPAPSCYLLADQSGASSDADFITRVDVGGPSSSEKLLGNPFQTTLRAMAVQPGTGRIFATAFQRFGEIDGNSGAFTQIKQYAPNTGAGSLGTQTFDQIVALSFDPFDTSGQTLYAVVQRPSAADLLFRIDPSSGEHVAGAFAGDDYLVLDDSSGLGQVNGISFDPTDRRLYAVVSNDSQADDRLATINPFSGQVSLIGTVGQSGVQGLSFTNDGILYAVAGDSPSQLVSIDKATGVGTTLGNVGQAVDGLNAGDSPLSDYEGIECALQPLDIRLEKSVSPATVAENGTASFTVTVTNDGSSLASGIEVSDLLPSGLQIDAIGPSQGSYDEATGIWTLGGLAAGADAELLVAVTAPLGTGGSSFDNVAEVTAHDQFDINSTPNNQIPAENDQDNAVLTVTLPAPPNLPDAGVCLLLAGDSARNDTQDHLSRILQGGGSSDERYIAATDTQLGRAMDVQPGTARILVASGQTLQEVSLSGGSTLLGSFGTANGSAGAVVIDNVVAVSFDLFDASGGLFYGVHQRVAANDLLVRINPNTGSLVGGAFGGDDYVEIAASGSNADVGAIAFSPVDRRLFAVVNNAGSGDETVIIDTFTGAITVLGSVGQSDVQGLDFTNQGDLYAVAGSVAGQYFRINQSSGAAENVAAIGTADSAPAGVNPLVQYQGIACSLPPVDVSVSKSVSPSTVNEGDTITWTVQAINDGSARASGLVIEDRLPAGLGIDSHTASNGSFDPATGLWTIPQLEISETATLTFTSIAGNGTGGLSFTNVAELVQLNGSDTDSVPGNNDITEDDQDDATVTVNLPAPPNVEQGNACWLFAGNSIAADEQDHFTTARLGSDPSSGGITISEQYVNASGTTQGRAMAVDPATGLFYFATSGQLYSYVPSLGGSSNVIGSFGSGTGSAGSVTMDNIVAMDFDPFDQSGGTLYLIHRRNAATDLLFRANPATGAIVSGAFGGDDYVELGAVGGAQNAGALAINPITRAFHAAFNNNGSGDVLASVNPSSGATSAIGSIGLNDVRGLAYTTTGILAGVAGGTASQAFFVDVASGASFNQLAIGVANGAPASNNPLGAYEGITCDLPPADVQLEKVATPASINEGDNINWVITVTNQSSVYVTGIDVVDRMLGGLNFESAATSKGAYDPATRIWRIPAIGPNASAQLTLTSTAPVGSGGLSFENVGEVVFMDQFDTDSTPANDDINEDDQDNVIITIETNTAPNLADTGACWMLAGDSAANNGGDHLTVAENGTAAANEVYLAGLNTTAAEAMAAQPGSGRVLLAAAGTVHLYDQSSGNASALGTPGTANGSLGAIDLNNITALAFDPFDQSGGVLFGLHSRSGEADLIFRIDPSNGSLLSGAMDGDDYRTVASAGDVLGLAIHPVTHTYYAVLNEGAGDQLITLNPFNGEFTIVGSTSAGIAGLSFSNQGQLYAVTNNQYLSIDTNSGAATVVDGLGTALGTPAGNDPLADYNALDCSLSELVTLNGVVFEDNDSSSSFNSGDAGISAVAVVLYDEGTGQCIAEATTDSNGAYSFIGVDAGDYQVIEASGANLGLDNTPGNNTPVSCTPANLANDPSGFYSTTPNTQLITLNGDGTIANRANPSIWPATLTSVDFGETTGTPYASCYDAAYQSSGSPGNISYYQVDLPSGVKSLYPAGNTTNYSYINALGYNPVDNFIYAYDQNLGQFTRIDQNGNWTQLSGTTGQVTGERWAGTITGDGYWLLASGNSTSVQVVDVDPSRSSYLNVVNTLTLPQQMGSSDWAWNSVDDRIYAIEDGTYQLYRFNFNGPVETATSINREFVGSAGSGSLFSVSAGAQYFDILGNYYYQINDEGTIYRITDVANRPLGADITAAALSTGATMFANDGAGCIPQIDVDFGDAPATYPAANHNVSPGETGVLGALRDFEEISQFSANADGDDVLGSNDDDGVSLAGNGLQGQSIGLGSTELTITTSASGFLSAWIDFNGDGDFDDANEQVATNTAVSAGANALNVTVTATDIAGFSGNTFARFRYTESDHSGLTAGGFAVAGEVEDYQIVIAQPEIPGVVFLDDDASSSFNNSENGINGVEVVLYNETTGQCVGLASTDANGAYVFTGVAPGDYQVIEADGASLGLDESIGDNTPVSCSPESLVNDPSGVFSTTPNIQLITVNPDGTIANRANPSLWPATLTSVDFGEKADSSFGQTCNIAYQTQGSAGNLNLFEFDLAAGSLNPYPAGNTTSYDGINALGFNRVDGFIYGVIGVSGQPSRLSRIDSNGEWIQFTATDGSIPYRPSTGTINDQGYWLIGRLDQPVIYIVDVDPNRSSYLQVVNSIDLGVNLDASDIAWNPVDSQFYFIEDTTFDLHRLEFAGPVQSANSATRVEIRQIGSGISGFSAGAQYFDLFGNLYFQNNDTGSVYRVNEVQNLSVGGTVATSLMATGQQVFQNDGAGCVPAILLEYSDAPATYPVAQHNVEAQHTALLGTERDFEPNPHTSDNADGDDTNGLADDDGVTLGGTSLQGQSIGVGSIDLTVAASAAGFLSAWVDFNGDGDFDDANEQIATNLAVVAGDNTVTVTITNTDIGGFSGASFARFRYTEADHAGLAVGGPVVSGEVEDYQVIIGAPQIVGVVFIDTDASSSFAPPEAGQSGIAVVLYDEASGQCIAQATTDANGNYEFNDVVPGDYRVIEANGASTGLDNTPADNTAVACDPLALAADPTGLYSSTPNTQLISVAGDGVITNRVDPSLWPATLTSVDFGDRNEQTFGACEAAYQTHGSAANTIQLYDINLATAQNTPHPAGGSDTVDSLNAVGFNRLDGLLYGVRVPSSGPTVIVRIDNNGSAAEFSASQGNVPSRVSAGTVNDQGYLILNRFDESTVYVVDIDASRPSFLQVVNTLDLGVVSGAADWEWNPVDGNIYYVERTTFDLYRVVFNGTAEAATSVSREQVATVSTSMAGVASGSMFFDDQGGFYFIDNSSGDTYTIRDAANRSGAIEATKLADGEPVLWNDGAGCAPVVQVEFSDAPAAYPIASHTVEAGSSGFLGATRDFEDSAAVSPNADGDDTLATDDDDGVTVGGNDLQGQVIGAGSTTLTVNASQAGVLNAWIDFNGDGDFADAGEQIATNLALNAGDNDLIINPTAAEFGSFNGNTVARFRFSALNQATPSPSGIVLSGEVEDYLIVVKPAALTAEKEVGLRIDLNDDGNADANETLRYTIRYSNPASGSVDINNFQVNDVLPTEVTYVADSLVVTDAAGCVTGETANSAYTGLAANAGLLQTAVVLPQGCELSFQLDATINADVTAATTITNTANAVGDELVAEGVDAGPVDIVTDNDPTRPAHPDLLIEKTHTPATFVIGGDSNVFNLLVKNVGAVDSSGLVTVTDPMPADITMTATPTGDGWDCSTSTAETLVCARSDALAAGSNYPLITAPVAVAGAADSRANTATVEGGGDLSGGEDTDVVTTSAIDVELTKTVDNAAPNEGDSVTFTITLVNVSDQAGNNVVVTESLPIGLVALSATVSDGTYDEATDVWTVPTLASNDPQTLTLVAVVSAGTGGQTLTNTAEVTAHDEQDSDSTPNNQEAAEDDIASVDVVVIAPPLLPLVEDPARCFVIAGDSVAGDANDHLTRVDLGGSDGSEIYVGAPSSTGQRALTAEPTTGKLWVAEGSRVYVLSNGDASQTGDSVTLTTADGPLGSITLNNLVAISFDPGDGILYAVHRRGAGEADILVRINTTSMALETGAFFGDDYAVIDTVTVGADVLDDINGIAFDPANRTLFAIAQLNGGNDHLVEIDRFTGAIDPASAKPLSQNDVNGLGFDNSGLLYAVAGGSPSSLYRVDLSTAALLPAMTLGSNVEGIPPANDPLNSYEGIACNLAPSDVAVSKSVSPTAVAAGGTITWTITATNENGGIASGIVIEDRMDSQLTIESATPSVGSFDVGTARWTLPELAAGASATLTLTSTAPANAAGQLATNVAELLDMDQFDLDSTPANNAPAEDDQDDAEVSMGALDPAPVCNGDFASLVDWGSSSANLGGTEIQTRYGITSTITAVATGAGASWLDVNQSYTGNYGGSAVRAMSGVDVQIQFSKPVSQIRYYITDIDGAQEVVTVAGSLAGGALTPSVNLGPSASGVATVVNPDQTVDLLDDPSDGTADQAPEQQAVFVGFSEPVDTITFSSTATGTSRQHLFDIQVCGDFNDSPLVGQDALHIAAETSGVQLGAAVDGDAGPYTVADATGDGADDDGVTLNGATLQDQTLNFGNSNSYDLTVETVGAGTLYTFVDWNADGDFDDANEVVPAIVSGGGNVTVALAVPNDALVGQTFIRFRYSNDPDAANASGAATGGEVEDYRIFLSEDGVPVSGNVYHDVNHDGSPNNGETWADGTVVFVNLVDAGGNVVQSIELDPGSGAYNFGQVIPGEYTIIVTDSATNPAPAAPTGWLEVNPVPATRAITVQNVAITNQNFGLFHGSKVSGSVILDNGNGGGVPNDGQQNGAEGGIGGVEIEVFAGGSLQASTVTDANGDYLFWLPSTLDGQAVVIRETNKTGFLSTGGEPGNTAGSYDRNADETTFTFSSGVEFVDIDFFDTEGIRFSPDGQNTVEPGAVVFYPHTFDAGSGGTVNFTISDSSIPNNDGWSYSLLRDSNCNGQLDGSGEPILNEGQGVTVTANEDVCVLVKVQAPSSATSGAQHVLEITANFNYDNASPSLTQSLTRTDVTLTGEADGAGLTLHKEVDKLQALPGDVLTYTITFKNESTRALSQITIEDATPEFTNFASATCPASFPLDLTGCAVTTAPAVGGVGPVIWTLSGELRAGGEGSVTYQVRIDN